jgi:hypothetical protein
MKYPDTNLNGWDYVLAITEEQVNNGLRIAYHGSYQGPQLPRMPAGMHSMKLDEQGHRHLECKLGCPTVHAVRAGLNLCDLVIPLMDATIKTHGKDPVHLPRNASLRITTSLTSMEVEIRDAAPDSGTAGHRHHEVFVNFKDERAVYKVAIGHGEEHALSLLETVLKKRLQTFTGREFRIGCFQMASDADPFVPRLLDFSFVLSEGEPTRNAFLICGALDATGPQVDDRLVFESKILPETVPAALWFGSRFVMDGIIAPMIRDSLKNPYRIPDIAYDGTKVFLAARFDLGDIQGHRTWMEECRITPSAGKLLMHTRTTSYRFTGLFLDAAAVVDGHISFGVSADHATFTSSSAVVSHTVDVLYRSSFERWLLAFITLGTIEAAVAIISNILKDKVGISSVNTMDAKLKESTGKINAFAPRIPALEDLSAGGHLLFDDIALQDSGAVCIGIKRTQVA